MAISQSRIGISKTEIKQEGTEIGISFTDGYTTDNEAYVFANTDKGTIIHYLDSNELCNMTIFVPSSVGVTNAMVEKFNKKYVILSDTEWKAYLVSGAIVHIELLFDADANTHLVVFK